MGHGLKIILLIQLESGIGSESKKEFQSLRLDEITNEITNVW